MSAPLEPATSQSVERAAALLRKGGVVALPTETVYGLGVDAANPQAVARVFDIKGRPAFNPLIVHVRDHTHAREMADLSPSLVTLIDAFWPGPLTVVATARGEASVCDLARAGLDTVAVRAPSHPAMRAVLNEFGGPIAAPSANTSGALSPTRAMDVARDLGEAVDLIIDGGPSSRGLESTVVAETNGAIAVLREGALPREALAERVRLVERDDALQRAERPSSPGQLLRHYAPRRARLRLNADAPDAHEAYLGFGPCAHATLTLSASGDVREASARLFACLRALDDAGFAAVAVAPIPEAGLGRAINDRLRRAAGLE